MKNWECRKVTALFFSMCILIMFSSCNNTELPPDLKQETQPSITIMDSTEEETEADSENSAAPEEEMSNPVDFPEEQDSQEPQENFLALYIGKTVGEVVQDLGDEYVVDYFEGSTMIGYPGNLWFLFGNTEENITDDLIIRQMIASGQRAAVYELAGSMTYSEIVEAVDEEADIPQPEYYYSEIDDSWTYSTSFIYRGYQLIYTWLEDPDDTLSASVIVFNLDVDIMPPIESASTRNPPKEPDNIDDTQEEAADSFCGPGWFYGVMGSQFYVPDGFIQQDAIPALGQYYVFENAELDMSISVQEATYATFGFDSSEMADEYTSRKSGDSVTYAASGDNFYVVSGIYGSDSSATIYYNRVDYDEDFRYEVEFLYPASQAEECEEILLEFLINYLIS